jgi:hypothetical protein
LESLVVQHLTVARVAEGLGVSWNTANHAVLAEGQRAFDRRLPGSTVSRSSALTSTSGDAPGAVTST